MKWQLSACQSLRLRYPPGCLMSLLFTGSTLILHQWSQPTVLKEGQDCQADAWGGEQEVTAPAAAAATNLLNTTFRMKYFVKVDSWHCSLMGSEAALSSQHYMEKVQLSNLSIERNQKNKSWKGCVRHKCLRKWTTVSKTTWKDVFV